MDTLRRLRWYLGLPENLPPLSWLVAGANLSAPALVLAIVQAFHQPTPSWIRILLCASYAVLLLGSMINSFFGLKKSAYVMSVQPSGALIFAVVAVIWISRQYASFSNQTRQAPKNRSAESG